MQLDPEDQTDDEQAVSDDRRRRGRFQPKRVKNKVLGIVGQSLAFPEDIPDAVEKDMSHSSVVLNGEREFLPVHRQRVAEDVIYDTESGFRVRVSRSAWIPW